MSIAVQLRALTTDDAHLCLGIERSVFPEEAWSLQMLEEELGSPWSTYLGAFAGDCLVGYAGIKGDLEGDVMTMGVAQEFRGRGVGAALLDALIASARERGMERLFLEVRESSAPARRLYSSRGFVDLSRVSGYYRAPLEDAITMALAL